MSSKVTLDIKIKNMDNSINKFSCMVYSLNESHSYKDGNNLFFIEQYSLKDLKEIYMTVQSVVEMLPDFPTDEELSLCSESEEQKLKCENKLNICFSYICELLNVERFKEQDICDQLNKIRIKKNK